MQGFYINWNSFNTFLQTANIKKKPIFYLLSNETFYASCPSVFTKGRMVAYDLLAAGVAQLLGG